MTRRKPMAAVAAVTAALALAVPAGSASAATPYTGLRLQPGSLPCQILIAQVRVAAASGNTVWANVISNVFVYSGCGGAAI